MEGKFTNHSLCATCTSGMYENYVPEQLIKEITGHRSECVRIYKHTSDKLKESASCTLCVQSQENVVKLKESGDNVTETESELSVQKMIENVNKTKKEIRRKNSKIRKTRLSLLRFRKQQQGHN